MSTTPDRRRLPVKLCLLAFVVAVVATVYRANNSDPVMAASSSSAAAYIRRQAVVVGATSGIGHGVAVHLASLGFSVIGVGRSLERGQQLVADMERVRPAGVDSPQAFVPCDVLLMKNVRRCVRESILPQLSGDGDGDKSLDVLVLTQGVGSIADRTPTAEGIDEKLATHYYSRVAFALELLPALARARGGRGRVMTVLAAGKHPAYEHYADDPLLLHHYSLYNAANAAVMYNDLACDSLAHEHPSVSFYHAYPGFVNTNWGSEMPWLLRMLVRAVQPLGTKPSDCARVLCSAMLADDQAVPGPNPDLPNFHLIDDKGRPTTPTSLHDQARPVIWQHTIDTLNAAYLE